MIDQTEDTFGGIDFNQVNPCKLEALHMQVPVPEGAVLGSKAVVLYHGNCTDGFGAAWAFKELKAKYYLSVDYIEGHYNVAPPIDIPEYAELDDLYILDFSLKKPDLIYLCQFFRKVTLIDHHKTAEADLMSPWVIKPMNLEIIFNMEKSGALLTWETFAFVDNKPPLPPPPLIQYISDRDLWKFELDYSKEVSAYIHTHKRTFEDFTGIDYSLRWEFPKVTDAGRLFLAQTENLVDQLTADNRLMIITVLDKENRYEHFPGLVCNCSPQFSSDVGNRLANITGTYGATYHTDKNGVTKFSLRSNGDYDVSELAKKFGGGGHKNAAGFVIASTEDGREVRLSGYDASEET